MGAGALAAGAAVVGAGASMYGSSQAAGAAKNAAGQTQQMYQTTRNDLSPYNVTGESALHAAYNIAQLGPTGGGPDYVAMQQQFLPPQMTQAQLEQTPGYQFTRSQGLKAVQGAAAARGLGVSGAALKGAGDYATGLADKTYLDQFNVAQQRFTDVGALNTAQQSNLLNYYNRYKSLADLGESAAAQTGAAGTSLAEAGARQTAAAGVLQGSGAVNAANALTGGVNNYLAYQQMQQYLDRNPATQGANAGAFTGTNAGGDLFAGNTMG